jgi:hypothetical protein
MGNFYSIQSVVWVHILLFTYGIASHWKFLGPIFKNFVMEILS